MDLVAGIGGIAKNYFVGIFEAKGNDIAILKLAAFHFIAVNEKPAALAAIFQIEAIGFGDDGGTIPRNAAVGELQMVAGFRATADVKGRLRDARETTRAVGRDDFEYRFSGQGHRIGHRCTPGVDCSMCGQATGQLCPANSGTLAYRFAAGLAGSRRTADWPAW